MLTNLPECSWSIQTAIRNHLFQMMIDVTGVKVDKGDCNNCGCIIVLVSTKLFFVLTFDGEAVTKNLLI